MPATVKTQGHRCRCRECARTLDDLFVKLFGYDCHDCRNRAEVRAAAREYFERALEAENDSLIEDLAGAIEDVLVRHGVALS